MKRLILAVLLSASCLVSLAQKDTLRVMGYNVLYYGSGCQGPNSLYHSYLKTIVGYTNPDILSLEKMGSIKLTPDDKYGAAPYGFADSILLYALDSAFPCRYGHCPFTNESRTNNMSVIFYDKRKLGFVSIVYSYANITDFNLYKLYYKDRNLAKTHDTTFLYIMPNHDMSGDEFESVRGLQIGEVVKRMKAHFSHLPNMINIGDFNVRTSREPFYQELTDPDDTNFKFFDPPFLPDQKLKYPANWDHDSQYAAYFTTSTRESSFVPNPCGTGGGGKNWYDHIFLSGWIVNGANYIKYVPHSYRTIGNDGQRLKVAINNSNVHVNTSAPADVIEALYQMSNKYPVMLDMEVSPNINGVSPPDPEIAGKPVANKESVFVDPVSDGILSVHLPADVIGQQITISFLKDGDTKLKKTLLIKDRNVQIKCKLSPGAYFLQITGHHNVMFDEQMLVK